MLLRVVRAPFGNEAHGLCRFQNVLDLTGAYLPEIMGSFSSEGVFAVSAGFSFHADAALRVRSSKDMFSIL